MKKTLPFWTYTEEFRKNKKTLTSIITHTLEAGTLILGGQVRKLEQQFSSYCGCKHGVGLNSGTDALFLSLKALGVGPGDEVITVPNSAIPTVSAIVATGARPVFVDIDPRTLLMDAQKIESAVSKSTKCIVPVHLYGNVCDMDAITRIAKRHKMFVLEDCAQATGATYSGKKVGSMSDIAAFSFYPTKIIGAYGDGGMVTTNNAKLADKVRLLRMYGTSGDYYSTISGYNSRLDELQAAILLWKLGRIESYIKAREEIAKHYTQRLSDTPLVLPPTSHNSRHVWHLYVVRHEKSDVIIKKMKERGITLAVHYRHPLHLQEAYRYLGYKSGDFPHAEQACGTVLSLPIYPELTKKDQKSIITTLREVLEHETHRS